MRVSPELHREDAISAASKAAGAHVTAVGKTDVKRFTRDEWRTLLGIVIDAAMAEMKSKHDEEYRKILNGLDEIPY